MDKKTKNLSGISSLLTATFIYGFFGILSRLIGFSIPLFYQTGLRAILAALIILVLIYFWKAWQKLNNKDLIWIIVRSFFGFIAIVAFFVAVNYMQLGTVYFIFYAGSTLGGYILGKILFKENLTILKIISLILSLFGLYLIYSLSIDTSKIYFALLSLLSGVSTALWNTLSKKIGHAYSALQLSFMDNLIGGILALIVSVVLKESWLIPTINSAWGVNALFACLYVLTGQLVIFGFRRMDAQIGSLVMLTEVIFGLVLGLIFYQEIVAPMTILGGGLILAAIILPELSIFQSTKKAISNNKISRK